MKGLRLLFASVLVFASVIAAIFVAATPALGRTAHPDQADQAGNSGRIAVRGGLTFLELSGAPAERGREHARLGATQIADLLGLMRWNPGKAMTGRHLAGCIAAISAADRAEIDALAEGLGMPVQEVLNANAIIETMCSAVVRVPPGGAPVVARNMDFFPPGALGQATVVQVVRTPGRHAYAAVSWPGLVGVISGINDRGLTACILLNWHGAEVAPAEPLPLRTRRILTDCPDLASALAAFAASPVGSRHYLLLADAQGAALAWWTPTGVRIDRPSEGWLVATNLARTDGRPVSDDPRGNGLGRCLAAVAGEPDPAWFRRVVSASYLRGLNAQAMVFAPATRRLELALATATTPAAHRPWFAVDLGAILDGAAVDSATVTNLPAETPLRHYLQGGD